MARAITKTRKVRACQRGPFPVTIFVEASLAAISLGPANGGGVLIHAQDVGGQVLLSLNRGEAQALIQALTAELEMQ